MIKRTLYFGNPAYLKIQNEQLVFERKIMQASNTLLKYMKVIIKGFINIKNAIITKILVINKIILH
jgi:hypothetical protein